MKPTLKIQLSTTMNLWGHKKVDGIQAVDAEKMALVL
jgi:hypothetical protein